MGLSYGYNYKARLLPKLSSRLKGSKYSDKEETFPTSKNQQYGFEYGILSHVTHALFEG